MPRLLAFAALVLGCTLAHEALPAPERSLTVFVVMFAGPVLLRYWASKDPVERKPADDSRSGALPASGVRRQVWRVRLWVRIAAVAVPLAGLPFLFQPQLLNPEWAGGVPVGELVVAVLFYAVLGFGRGRRSGPGSTWTRAGSVSPIPGRAGCSCVRR